MKRNHMILRILAVIFMGAFLAACGSMRFSTTLKPEPGTNKIMAPGNQKFSIVQFNKNQDKTKTTTDIIFAGIDLDPVNSISGDELRKHAIAIYPEVFGKNFDELPVSVDVDAKCVSHEWLQALGLWILPFPAGAKIEYTVQVRVFDGNEMVVNETPSFIQKFAWWRTVTPLGVLPVLGFSDVRSTSLLTGNFQDDKFRSRLAKLTMDSIVEAVAQVIRNADPEKIKMAAANRKERIQQITVNDRTFWYYLDTTMPDGGSGKPASGSAVVSLFSDYPSWDAKKVESAVVARMRDGQWEPVTGYLRSVQPLASIKASLKNDKPSKIIVKNIAEPPLEDFIDLPDNHKAADVRWSNQMLVEAKNTSLPRLLEEGTPQEMKDMITRIEKTVLDLNEKAAMADYQVQKLLNNGGDSRTANAVNNLAVLYRQRITILEAIIPALKQAGAAKADNAPENDTKPQKPIR